LEHAKSSEGIFAPTLRYHDGTFFLITTNVSGGGNFYVTARDPAGEWSDPVWLRESSWGMDPSLLFDDDGRVYYTRHGGGEHGGVFQAELDVKRGKLLGEPRLIWEGTGGIWPEGPHLYRVKDRYYLMISEGGTGYGHMLTVARASSPWGPFEPFPGNPILTHRDSRQLPIQATGHGDLVRSPNGAWWMVLLGIRPWDGRHHHLGRETFLAPVAWDPAGWPVVHEHQPIALEMKAPGLLALRAGEAPPARDDFSTESLALVWNFIRNPNDADWSLAARSGWLRLRGPNVSLNDVGSPAFLGRRQQHYRCHASALLEFQPQSEDHQAGLVVRANEKNHHDLVISGGPAGRRARLRTCVKGESRTVAEVEVPDGPLVLTIRAREDQFEFLRRANHPLVLRSGRGVHRRLLWDVRFRGRFPQHASGRLRLVRLRAGPVISRRLLPPGDERLLAGANELEISPNEHAPLGDTGA
jgi:alpha-N-arabinofuranosidase